MAQGGPARKSCIYARKSTTKFKPSFKSQAARAKCGPSYNKARGRSSPPPRGGSSGLARASPALFADKVLTHHIHHRKSTPPLRKPPTAQKALRALWPWLGHAGSTKFGRPRKTQAFFGAPELRPRAGVVRKGRTGYHLSIKNFSRY